MKNHYKEASPANTVHRIREILHKHELPVYERDWVQTGKGFYSLSLLVGDTPLRTNGKGISQALSQASAYGEMMERLQNMCVFRLVYDFPKEVWYKYCFCIAPDEVYMSTEKLLESPSPWMQHQLDSMHEDIDLAELMRAWHATERTPSHPDFLCLPFYHVNTQSVDYLPLCIISKLYTSNGMCGGNTKAEALVQGLCEVYERYANIRLLEENITPPDIPIEEIRAIPALRSMVDEITAIGQYDFYFKDCSLGMDLPVVAVICVDRSSGQYFVKFGSSPLFEIAIERTLTELLQGQSLTNMKGMRHFKFDTNDKNPRHNTMSILINGCGDYPPSFFAGEPSYEHKPYTPQAFEGHDVIVRQMIENIKNRGWDLYIRDVSFMGFPAYQVIIPGVSEVEFFDDIKSYTDYGQFNEIKKAIRLLHTLSHEEITKLTKQIEDTLPEKNVPVTQWTNHLCDPAPWIYQNTNWLLAALYCATDDYKNAQDAFRRFLIVHEATNNSQSSTYYECVDGYLGLRSAGYSEDMTQMVLRYFYPLEMVNLVNDEFGHIDLTSKDISLRCFECQDCPYKSSCKQIALQDAYLKFKKLQIEHPISQHNII